MHPLSRESHELIARVTALIEAARAGSDRSKRLVPCSQERVLWASGLIREREALHDAVDAFARKARDSGLPPEHMLVLLKGAMRDPGLAQTTKEVMVRWSVCAYYAA